MEAQISGTQRKIFGASVRPLAASAGLEGIAVRRGITLPFLVTRSWSAPAGTYPEAWYLVDPSSKEVLYESEQRYVSVWGLQGLTELETEVRDPVGLDPGTYEIVFALGGVKGGQIEVEVRAAADEAVA